MNITIADVIVYGAIFLASWLFYARYSAAEEKRQRNAWKKAYDWKEKEY